MEKVSVIIPTYNRFKYLLNTINSIREQTYKNIEIIVVNDKSPQQEYYTHDWSGIVFINLEKGSRDVVGYPCAAYVRNEGISQATGDYIAFCDDDDIWLPEKIETQLNTMKESGCKMCCTEGYIGSGIYDKNNKYELYISEKNKKEVERIFYNKGSSLIANGYPKIWTKELMNIHNCAVCSSVIVSRELIFKVDGMRYLRCGEDYDCWLRIMDYTDCVYVNKPLFYYDNGHGDGANY